MEQAVRWKEVTSKKKYTADVIEGVAFDHYSEQEYNPKYVVNNLIRLTKGMDILNQHKHENIDNVFDLVDLINEEYNETYAFYISHINIFLEDLMIDIYQMVKLPLIVNFKGLEKLGRLDEDTYRVAMYFMNKVSDSYAIEGLDSLDEMPTKFISIYYDIDNYEKSNEEILKLIYNLKNSKIKTAMHNAMTMIDDNQNFGTGYASTYIMTNEFQQTNEEIESNYEEMFETTESLYLESFLTLEKQVYEYAIELDKFENELIEYAKSN